MERDVAFRLVKDELERATAHYPDLGNPHEGYAILLEEVDELWDEIKANRGRTDRAVSEAVQTAAMAIRYLIDLCEDGEAARHENKVAAALSPTRTFFGYSG